MREEDDSMFWFGKLYKRVCKRCKSRRCLLQRGGAQSMVMVMMRDDGDACDGGDEG